MRVAQTGDLGWDARPASMRRLRLRLIAGARAGDTAYPSRRRPGAFAAP